LNIKAADVTYFHCLWFFEVSGMVGAAMFGYIVAHYCLVFTTGAVRIVVVGDISPIIVRCLLGEWFLLLCLVILSPITVLRFDRGVVPVAVVGYIVVHYL